MNLVKPESITTTGAITRSTVGTYFDSAGTLQSAAINTPRINYDPTTNEFLGVLLENSGTNLVEYSEQFDAPNWSKLATTVTVNSTVSPDGTNSADLLVEASTTNIHDIYKTSAITTTNSIYTFSVFAKAGTRSFLGLNFDLSSTLCACFNLTTGTVSAIGTEATAKIQKLNNGWYRCSITVTLTAGTHTPRIALRTVSGTSSQSYAGNGLGLYIWGAQVELGTITSYIKSFASATSRAADIVTGSGLVYTNLTNAYAEWSAATTYSLGTSVSYGSYGTYVSLQNSNLNQNPLTATTYWVRSGPTNKMAAFDEQISSVSSSTSDIIFAVTSSSIDTVALLNVTGSKTSIVVTDSDLKSEIYRNSQQLVGGESLDWFSYFFYDSDTVRTMSVYMDIPIASNALITVKVSGIGTISLGTFITGVMKMIGNTQYGVSAGIIDYSRKDTDEFGNVSFIKRNYSKRINASVSLTNSNLNKVQRLLYQIRATPVLWLASTDIQFEEPLITYGFYRDFSTEISYPTHSLCNLQIEGLI